MSAAAQSLAPDYAAVNGSPCKISSNVQSALTAVPTRTTAPSAVLNENTSSAAPLTSLLPRGAAATEASLGSSIDAKRAPGPASTEQSDIVNTFDNLFPPYDVSPSAGLQATAGIRASNGILYGANGKPVVLKVSKAQEDHG